MRRQNDAVLILPVVHLRVKLGENLSRIELVGYAGGVAEKRPAPFRWIGRFP